MDLIYMILPRYDKTCILIEGDISVSPNIPVTKKHGLYIPLMNHCIQQIYPSFLKDPNSFSYPWEHAQIHDNQISLGG